MKIKKEHYKELKKQFENIIDSSGFNTVMDYGYMLKANKQKGLTTYHNFNTRFMFDVFHMIDRKWKYDFTKEFYTYANDSHLTTAVLKIGHELKLIK